MEAHQLPSGTYLEQDKYYIDRVLGDGGFGITYLGFDVKLQRKVAIKEFYMRGYCYRNPGDPNVYACEGEKGAAFERMKQQYIEEGRVLAVLGEQPGVVNIYTFIEENNTAYLVMDFVEGQSLDAYIKSQGGRLSVTETLAIMRPVILALAGVHKHGVVHRDISPDNIMITHDRKVKLIDFGAARQYGKYNSGKVQKGGFTPVEQVTPQGQVGPYSDVYALCATMYRCMTGVNVPRAKERVKQDVLVPPSEIGITIPPQVEDVLMRGLAIEPVHRFANAERLYQALYEELTQESRNVSASVTYSGISRMLSDMQAEQKKQVYRKKRIGVICGIVLLLAVVVSVYLQKRQDGTEPTVEPEETMQQILQTEIDASPVKKVDCTAYAQAFYELCAEQHEAKGNTLIQRDEFMDAAKETAVKSAALTYTGTDELNAALTEIGNQTIAAYEIPDTGWVTYTFSLEEDVTTVKQALDTYIAQMNEENQGTVDLDNCTYLGVSVARAQDGTFFWAVFYQ